MHRKEPQHPPAAGRARAARGREPDSETRRQNHDYGPDRMITWGRPGEPRRNRDLNNRAARGVIMTSANRAIPILCAKVCSMCLNNRESRNRDGHPRATDHRDGTVDSDSDQDSEKPSARQRKAQGLRAASRTTSPHRATGSRTA